MCVLILSLILYQAFFWPFFAFNYPEHMVYHPNMFSVGRAADALAHPSTQSRA
jgi:hypothetical protein